MASIRITTRTHTSFSICIYDFLPEYASSAEWYIQENDFPDPDTNYYLSRKTTKITDNNGDGESDQTVSFSSLTPQTFYGFLVRIIDSNGNISGRPTLGLIQTLEAGAVINGRVIGRIEDVFEGSYYNPGYEVTRFEMSFARGGTAKFAATASDNVASYIWLSSSAYDCDDELFPSYDGGVTLANGYRSITYNVNSYDTYYLFVRRYMVTTGLEFVLTITAPEQSTRPDDFSWTYQKTKGGVFNLTASEWNSLVSRINDFREYKGLGYYSFTMAYKGDNFMAYMYNQARLAIQGISGYGTSIPNVSAGQNITAYMMNVLVSELNAIP